MMHYLKKYISLAVLFLIASDLIGQSTPTRLSNFDLQQLSFTSDNRGQMKTSGVTEIVKGNPYFDLNSHDDYWYKGQLIFDGATAYADVYLRFDLHGNYIFAKKEWADPAVAIDPSRIDGFSLFSKENITFSFSNSFFLNSVNVNLKLKSNDNKTQESVKSILKQAKSTFSEYTVQEDIEGKTLASVSFEYTFKDDLNAIIKKAEAIEGVDKVEAQFGNGYLFKQDFYRILNPDTDQLRVVVRYAKQFVRGSKPSHLTAEVTSKYQSGKRYYLANQYNVIIEINPKNESFASTLGLSKAELKSLVKSNKLNPKKNEEDLVKLVALASEVSGD
ncbi:MAG: hypothetical protein AAFX87_17665 [Bacteroidota bacterium]